MIIRLSNRVCSMVYYDMKVMIIFKLYNRFHVCYKVVTKVAILNLMLSIKYLGYEYLST